MAPAPPHPSPEWSSGAWEAVWSRQGHCGQGLPSLGSHGVTATAAGAAASPLAVG